MPPKKANTKAKATPAKVPAAAPEPPATVTNAKGKEIETTAAAGRSRRATAAPAETPKAKKAAPAKKAATKASTATTTSSAAGKKRGRPAKDADAEPPKKRGRPANGAPAVPLKENGPPKKRGRPPKGGETTKIEADDDAAAEQLGEELVENAAGEVEAEAQGAEDGPSKRTSPTKKKRGRPAKAKKATPVDEEDAVEEEEDLGVEEQDGAANGVSYWLMKAEQEDREETMKDGSVFNAKFTIDDLRDKNGPEPWDGVRNSVANKNMKDMKVGDLAFFYASGGKKGNVPGIVGIMEVVKEAEPDLSAFNENSAYFVENKKMRGTQEKPRWYMVHVEFRKKLSKPVTLKELQKYTDEGSVLADMQEFNAARLSVSKVAEEEWNFIVNELIDGYEDEAALPYTAPVDEKMMNGVTVTEAKESIESDLPTTDTGLAVETAASSRPASRAGSRPPSRAGLEKKSTSRPASRNGSLAPPPRATSRGRSRTPAARAGSAQPMATLTEEMEVVKE